MFLLQSCSILESWEVSNLQRSMWSVRARRILQDVGVVPRLFAKDLLIGQSDLRILTSCLELVSVMHVSAHVAHLMFGYGYGYGGPSTSSSEH